MFINIIYVKRNLTICNNILLTTGNIFLCYNEPDKNTYFIFSINKNLKIKRSFQVSIYKLL